MPRIILIKDGGEFDPAVIKSHGSPPLFGPEAKKGDRIYLITYLGSRRSHSCYCRQDQKHTFILSKLQKRGRTIIDTVDNSENELGAVDLTEVIKIGQRD